MLSPTVTPPALLIEVAPPILMPATDDPTRKVPPLAAARFIAPAELNESALRALTLAPPPMTIPVPERFMLPAVKELNVLACSLVLVPFNAPKLAAPWLDAEIFPPLAIKLKVGPNVMMPAPLCDDVSNMSAPLEVTESPFPKVIPPPPDADIAILPAFWSCAEVTLPKAGEPESEPAVRIAESFIVIPLPAAIDVLLKVRLPPAATVWLVDTNRFPVEETVRLPPTEELRSEVSTLLTIPTFAPELFS